MQPSDPRFVSSNRPFNRRTAYLAARKKQEINPTVQRQLAAIKAKHALGLPLLDQLQTESSAATHAQLPPKQIVLGIVAATSFTAGLLATIEQSMLVASTSGLCFLLSTTWLGLARRHHRQASATQATSLALFSVDSIIAFDRAIAALYDTVEKAEQPPHNSELQHKLDNLKSILLSIKAQFVRIHQLTENTDVQAVLSYDDQFYLNACLQRYLPDTLESYLRIPPGARFTQAVQGEQTALDLLLHQLHLLHTEIDQREQTLTKNAAEQLMRQQRFLEEKSRSSR